MALSLCAIWLPFFVSPTSPPPAAAYKDVGFRSALSTRMEMQNQAIGVSDLDRFFAARQLGTAHRLQHQQHIANGSAVARWSIRRSVQFGGDVKGHEQRAYHCNKDGKPNVYAVIEIKQNDRFQVRSVRTEARPTLGAVAVR